MFANRSAIGLALAGFLALFAAMGIARFAFTPLLPPMHAEGLLSIGQGGLVASVHFLGYAMGALLAGFITGAPRLALYGSLILIAVTTAAMGLVESMTIWFVARWIAGVCSAFVIVLVSNYIVKALKDAGRHALQGWVFAGVGGGTAVVGLAILGLTMAGGTSWAGWDILAILAVAAAAVVILLTARTRFDLPHETNDGNGGRTPLDWRIVIPYAAMGAGYAIPATYLPVMGQQVTSSPLIFGWGWPAFGLAAALSTLMAARWFGHRSNRSVWAVSQLIMAAGLILPVIWESITSIIVAAVCVGGTFMIITMVAMKESHNVAHGRDVQRHIAIMTAAFAVGQMISPMIAGWIHDATQSFAYPLAFASLLLVATCVLLLRPAGAPRSLPAQPSA